MRRFVALLVLFMDRANFSVAEIQAFTFPPFPTFPTLPPLTLGTLPPPPTLPPPFTFPTFPTLPTLPTLPTPAPAPKPTTVNPLQQAINDLTFWVALGVVTMFAPLIAGLGLGGFGASEQQQFQ